MVEDILELFGDDSQNSDADNSADVGNEMADGGIHPVAIDVDGDGAIDQILMGVDVDGDGTIDQILMGFDTDGDGTADQIFGEFDMDNDGISDGFFSVSDIAQEGGSGLVHIEAGMDLDGDGEIDVLSCAELDSLGADNGVISIISDSDGDHIWEAEQTFLVQDGNVVMMDSGELGESDAYEAFNPSEADMSRVVGDPVAYMDNWHPQETIFSCAVAAQEFVIEELLGIEVDEAELRRIAVENGWLSEAGTPGMDIGRLMEYMGLNVQVSLNNTFEGLCNSLARGVHPVVFVDADELWNGENEEIYLPGRDANHAVQVIGVDFNDPDSPMVILNDSGVANGCGAMIPADLFVGAWEDSECFMAEAYA